MEKNKVTTYLLYAIGEIFLVVIGILIAVQINTLATTRTNALLRDEYLKSLISDLEQDSIALMNDLAFIDWDLEKLNDFRIRLSSPEASMDTLRKIARFEFHPFFNPVNDLNRSTLSALLSSGDIKLFDKTLRVLLSNHNLTQIQLIKVMDKNVDIFLQNGIMKKELGHSEHPLTDSLNIRGKMLDQIWENIDNKNLLTSVPHVIASKTTMQVIIKGQKLDLQLATHEMLQLLRQEVD